ncbi:MAG: outer membrane protein assembly factor BamC [Gammaproteobacteria bacterium]|nr:outer membrane protein assembly factor BamC [Gammaproteobacteria bacterium]
MRKNLSLLNLITVLSIVVFISACSSDGEERPEYLDSYALEGLEIPPRLTRPNVQDELKIPEPSVKALALLKEREQVEGTVAPLFKGLTLKSEQGIYWLEIEQDADELWPLLKQFLAHEGIKIERDEPLLGFMETEWLNEYEPERDQAFYQRWLKAFSPDLVDKFRIRVERVPGKKLSRIFVSHRGLEIALAEDGHNIWQQRKAEPMLEREILYRMVMYTGLKQAAVDDVFASYLPYQARIRTIEGSHSGYEIVGEQAYVWQRVIHGIDRLGASIKSQDQQTGSIEVLVSAYERDAVPDVAKQSGKAAPSKAVDEDIYDMPEDNPDEQETAIEMLELDENQQPVKVFVQLKPVENSVQIYFSQTEGADIKSPLAVLFRDDLVTILK